MNKKRKLYVVKDRKLALWSYVDSFVTVISGLLALSLFFGILYFFNGGCTPDREPGEGSRTECEIERDLQSEWGIRMNLADQERGIAEAALASTGDQADVFRREVETDLRLLPGQGNGWRDVYRGRLEQAEQDYRIARSAFEASAERAEQICGSN